MRRQLEIKALLTAVVTITLAFATAASAGAESSTPSAPAHPNTVISCSSNTQYPHNSSHVSGTINAVGQVNCTGVVRHISLTVTLYNNNGVPLSSGTSSANSVSTLSANAAIPCSGGAYYGGTIFNISYPANYNPSTGSGSSWSPTVDLSCNGGNIVTSVSGG